MQEQELDQFLVDYHAPSDSIEVNCVWLQEQLRSAQSTRLQVDHLRSLLRETVATVERQQLAITAYREVQKNRKRLIKEYYV